MNRLVKVLLALVVAAGLGVGGWQVFEHFDRAGVVKDSKRACGTLDTPQAGAAGGLPLGLLIPSELKVLRVQTQGKTTLVVTSMDGKRAEVVAVRDRLVKELAGQRWTKKGQDQEPGLEAEAQFSSPDASLRVRPLCTGRLEVRLTIRG